jgi:hypothetical protein
MSLFDAGQVASQTGAEGTRISSDLNRRARADVESTRVAYL